MPLKQSLESQPAATKKASLKRHAAAHPPPYDASVLQSIQSQPIKVEKTSQREPAAPQLYELPLKQRVERPAAFTYDVPLIRPEPRPAAVDKRSRSLRCLRSAGPPPPLAPQPAPAKRRRGRPRLRKLGDAPPDAPAAEVRVKREPGGDRPSDAGFKPSEESSAKPRDVSNTAAITCDQPTPIDLSQKSTELYRILTTNETGSGSLHQGNQRLSPRKHIKREVIDQCIKPEPENTQKYDTSDHLITKNNELPIPRSVKQEHDMLGTQVVKQSMSPRPQLSSIKREPNQELTVPIEFDQLQEITELLNIPEQSPERDITRPQYREVPLEVPVKKEPFWHELDVTRINQNASVHVSSPRHPIKQELHHESIHQVVNDSPVNSDFQRNIIKQEKVQDSSQGAYEVPLQQPIKTEPYWPQLDVRGVQSTEHDLSQNQIARNREQYQIGTAFKQTVSVDMSKLLEQKVIKQELIHQHHPIGTTTEHSLRNMPTWHQPQIYQNEVAPTNAQPLNQSIEQELQYQAKPPEILLEQPKPDPPAWHRPEARNNNELSFSQNTLTQPKQEFGTQQYTTIPETPVLPMKKPFWFEQSASGYNRKADNFESAQQKSIKQELIHRHTATEIPSQPEVKTEPIHENYLPTNIMTVPQYVQQLKERMAKQQYQNILQQSIKPETYHHQSHPSVEMLQQHRQQLMNMKQYYQLKQQQQQQQQRSLPVENVHNLMPPYQQVPVASPPKSTQRRKQTLTRSAPVPEVPLHPLIPNSQRLQNMTSDVLRQPVQAQLLPSSFQQYIMMPGHEQTTNRKPKKRSRKEPVQARRTTEIPVVPPQPFVAQNPYWHQQELQRQQHLAAATHQHYQYPNYLQTYAGGSQVPLQYPSAQANWHAPVPTVQQSFTTPNQPAPSQQQTKPSRKRSAKKPPERTSGSREQMVNYELQWQQQAAQPPQHYPQPPQHYPQPPRHYPQPWQRWPTAGSHQGPNPSRQLPSAETLLLQQLAQQHRPSASKRSKKKPPPFETPLEMYNRRQQEQSQVTPVTPAAQGDSSGGILRAALSATREPTAARADPTRRPG